MKRTAAQLVLIDSDRICRNTVVEQDENNRVIQLKNLTELNVETAGTVFFDGLISPDLITISNQSVVLYPLFIQFSVYKFGNEGFQLIQQGISDNFILDCGSVDLETINHILIENVSFINQFDLISVIKSLTVNPALVCGKINSIIPGQVCRLIFWENCDLINKKITPSLKLL